VAAASGDLGGGITDAAIDRGPIEIIGESDLRAKYPSEQIISLDSGGKGAPIDGDATQSSEGRYAGCSTDVVRQWAGAGNQCVGTLSQCIGDDEIKRTNLVAAKSHRQKIVTLE
jgi:hypothetical protein